MIVAKATKKPLVPAHQSRDDFVEQEKKKRFIPAVFLLFVIGCVAYLRSFLPIRVEAREDEKTEEPNKENGEDAPKEEVRADAGEDEDITGSTERQRGSSTGEPPVRITLAREAEENLQHTVPTSNLNGLERTSKAYVSADSFMEPVRAIESRQTPQASEPIRIGGGGGGGGDSNGPQPGNPGTPDPPRNRAPRVSGPVYLQDTYGCQAFLISVLTLLAGASDADGDNLRVLHVSANWGNLSQTAEGGFSFTHDAGMLGLVKLSYFITDGQAIVPQVAYFNVIEAPPIVGTAGDDNLLGTQCADTIDGSAGDDNIDARDGNDLIIGGLGNDHIVAGAGNDVVYAGPGNDIVFAGAGNDIVFGGAGNDRIFGEDGDDILNGEDGDDFIDGGAGRDIILAGTGDDIARGGAGDDTIDGGEGDDRLDGEGGSDRLIAGAGNDIVNGGDGDDVIFDGAGRDIVSAGNGNDHVVAAADGDADAYDGGAGIDTLDYSESKTGVSVDLVQGVASGDDIGTDTVAGFEKVVGGTGRDVIVAGDGAVSIDGAAGNDRLVGGSFNDVISDGAGSDEVEGGAGDDLILAAADCDDDSYKGGAGFDTLSYATATLSVTVDMSRGRAYGSDIGQDLIESFEKIIGGSGDDHLIAGEGSVTMTGGRGKDTFEFQRKDDDHEPLLVRKITDFTVGDRIIAATYEISYLSDTDAGEQIEDLFDDIYLAGNQSNRPVRFRFEQQDEGAFTMVDVHDRPDHLDEFYTIEVAGHHHLQFTVAVS
ncbi:calcium-binding protein [Tardiphaga alba]|uniref:Calcium-binding protein n=1 Tax=Tardiphaga alba TaxID=340268 RepID=A0ABX8A3P7_9BRAD|nr:cadherin-like domain-containing protein [Tardiphaga alba]QUS38259.1 calcium-binding protein [Tardiphaga alba]